MTSLFHGPPSFASSRRLELSTHSEQCFQAGFFHLVVCTEALPGFFRA